VKQTRAAVVRRRRLATSATAAALLTAGILLATELPGNSSGQSGSKPPSPAAHPTSSTDSGDGTGDVASSRTLHQAIAAYVKSRDGAISVAVYDNNSKRLMLFHPKVRGRTASIVKADILETLLHRTGGHLTEDQRETATAMIENSDNDSATKLWDEDGGAPGVNAYNVALGLSQTTPNVDWGDTEISAADQVTLVRELFKRTSTLLTKSSRAYQRKLMRHVEADQRWGIGAGVPKSASFGNKNGWLPVDEDHDLWAVNSIGWVRGNAKSYEIAVITQHDATEGYGITTINHISGIAWRHASTTSQAASN
jgi:hypothetical protein